MTRSLHTGIPSVTAAAALKTSTTEPAARPMLQHQASLPHLPVPELNSTLSKYLQTLEPLFPKNQLDTTKLAVESFLAKEGPVLQKRLEDRANQEGVVNWLDTWWNDLAYFSYRDPLPFYVSYFFLYNNLKGTVKNTRRAAEIIQAAQVFKNLVVTQQLSPEGDRKGAYCMASYQYMFNATRIPKEGSDYVKVGDTANEHIIVIRKNKFYKLNLIGNEGRALSTVEIEAKLDEIIKLAGEKADQSGVGILTAENRDTWTKARKDLIDISSANLASLEQIESASYVMCLDDSSPADRDQGARSCWHGDGRNRFFDKSLQFIVFENGVAGFNGEHSRMDGTPTSRLNDFINISLSKNEIDHGTPSSNPTPSVEPLEFKLNPIIQTTISQAQVNFDQLVAKHSLKTAVVDGGKQLIKQFKVSPDAYVQMVIQLAFSNLHGKSLPTYESATTRKYQLGRTETCRTVSTQSVAFCNAMNDGSLSDTDKYQAALKAIKKHVEYMSQCVLGLGVDRHLLGLKLSLQPKEPVPQIFKDPSFSQSNHWNMSTSQLTSEHFDGYGWGMVVPDGYGIAYTIKNNRLQFNVTSIKPEKNDGNGSIVPDAIAMAHSIEKAGATLKNLFLLQTKIEPKL